MSFPHDPKRRALMSSMAAIAALGGSLTTTADSREARRRGSRTLVAYFSRSGNTRVVAGLIERSSGADLFEIRPARPYPEDYLETVEQARRERDRGYEPALQAKVSDMAGYDTVYLGFPIWGGTAPPVVRAFLSAHDLFKKNAGPIRHPWRLRFG